MTSFGEIPNRSELTEILTRSRELGFLSPQDIQQQIQHSLDFVSMLPNGHDRAIDLGAGGGLPSFVWLYVDLNIEVTAIDAMKKRCEFLELAASEHSTLSRLTIINGRAEELSKDPSDDLQVPLVVARGFGPPSSTAECSTRFLKIGGELVVSGRPEDEQERWDSIGLARLGLELSEIKESGSSHAAIIKKVSEPEPQYPRTAAAIKKRPLW